MSGVDTNLGLKNKPIMEIFRKASADALHELILSEEELSKARMSQVRRRNKRIFYEINEIIYVS